MQPHLTGRNPHRTFDVNTMYGVEADGTADDHQVTSRLIHDACTDEGGTMFVPLVPPLRARR